jgi:DNA-binding CsgD family transcriptional regulator
VQMTTVERRAAPIRELSDTVPPRSRRDGILTRREREIAVMAAQGLSNREVADVLVVSVRTVENHLYRVYMKLAVGGRGELLSALGFCSSEEGTGGAG